MEPLLYLDTARLGRMSPSAQRAQQDFARLAGEVGAAIRFEEVLQHGIEACKPPLRRRLPGLANWRGIDQLKQSLRSLAGFQDQLPLLLAARSAELMKFAAILLCRPCQNVLTTDLGWPPYHRILAAECRRTHRTMTVVRLADDIFRGRLTADEVVARVQEAYFAQRCDGLFLTAVSNRGARLPVSRITDAVEDRCRFVVVDGAQDFCHVGMDVSPNCCDLYLAGSHKWLGGYHPLGIGFYGRRRTRGMIARMLRKALETLRIEDPLLRFVERLETGVGFDSGETVNLTALFSCGGAIHDAARRENTEVGLREQLKNGDLVTEAAQAAGWRPCSPDPSLRSGIVLLESGDSRQKSREPELLRKAFHEHGVALTAYEGGVVRLSMPMAPLTSKDLAVLASALGRLA